MQGDGTACLRLEKQYDGTDESPEAEDELNIALDAVAIAHVAATFEWATGPLKLWKSPRYGGGFGIRAEGIMTVQISELVEVFAQMYRDKFLAAHPSLELCEANAQFAFLKAIQETGHAAYSFYLRCIFTQQ